MSVALDVGCSSINLALAVMFVGISAIAKWNREEVWDDLLLRLSSGMGRRITISQGGPGYRY